MKITARNLVFGAFALPLVAGLIAIIGACTPIQIGGEIVLNEDGSGSRKFEIYIYDEDDGEGGGNAYHFLNVHGAELKAAVEQKLKWTLNDASWLSITVDRGYGAMYITEIVTLSFNFTDFKDYTDKLKVLAKFGKVFMPEGSEFSAPTLKKVSNNQMLYTETAAASLWAIKPLFNAFLDDANLFDISGKGTNTLNSKNDLINMIGTEAVPFKVILGKNAPKLFIAGANINEIFPIGE